ncbi:MAG TPA: rhodanese-like domain-containing protein [Chthoniobacteraceae bacterium]|nr:rhodanese-like domain-containing protein [Chthoniobacteraceae bacterium]
MTTATTIDPTITMQELLQAFPGAQRALFRKYHIGGCSSCGFRPDETLAQVCERNERLPVNEVIDHIQASHEADLKMQIAPAELEAKLKNGEPVRLVDVRTREEYEAVHIEGSVLLSQDLMQEGLMKWDRTVPLVLIDHLGTRSLDAAAYFSGHGFEKAKALRGGIDAWSRDVDASLPRYHLE